MSKTALPIPLQSGSAVAGTGPLEVEAHPVTVPFTSRLGGPSTSVATNARPAASGKFLSVGGQKFYARGATYGAFRPDAHDNEYTDSEQVRRDFAQMASSGMNAVRIPHTIPPVELLDIARDHGLKVMVGLSAEQYVGYLIDRAGAPDIDRLIAEKVKSCAGHPAVLCYALGNEIPASVARWLGRRRLERYLERLHRVVKTVDPDGLVTYVNYPSPGPPAHGGRPSRRVRTGNAIAQPPPRERRPPRNSLVAVAVGGQQDNPRSCCVAHGRTSRTSEVLENRAVLISQRNRRSNAHSLDPKKRIAHPSLNSY